MSDMSTADLYVIHVVAAAKVAECFRAMNAHLPGRAANRAYRLYRRADRAARKAAKKYNARCSLMQGVR